MLGKSSGVESIGVISLIMAGSGARVPAVGARGEGGPLIQL